MFNFEIERWVPKFILADRNGYAVAKAIEAAMRATNEIVARGLACVYDYDTMPEWRLDELAWELNCLYDYTADVENKRKWVKNAMDYYIKYGTPVAIVKYLEGIFDSVDFEEWWKYDGDPYHFRVIVTGEWSDDADEWAKKAVATVQNVRSVLDAIIFNGGGAEISFYTAGAAIGMEIEDTAQIV